MAGPNKRLLAELKKASEKYAVELIDDDLQRWSVAIDGPENTPYEGGRFCVGIDFQPNHPMEPPTVVFGTKIFHPNITLQGAICIPALKNTDVATAMRTTATTILDQIVNLLAEPNFADALVPELVKIYNDDRPRYMKQAREWTKKYAK